MKKLEIILYPLLCVIYVTCCFYFFPELNSNVAIPSLPLLALGVWLFGTTTGLLLALFFSFITFLLSQIHGDEYIYYMDRATGPLLFFTIIFLFGELRKNYHGIRALNRELDKRIRERETELQVLTDQLIDDAETRRMIQGQELHDGIGQQLTGIQLLTSSLAHQLELEKHSLSQFCTSLMNSCNTVHNQIREIARTLFPIRIAQVGLAAALDELAECLSKIRPAQVIFKDLSSPSVLPENESLQLFRVCQESCINFIDLCKADQLEICIRRPSLRDYSVEIIHNGSASANHPHALTDLIQYRLKQVGGSQKVSATIDNRPMITFTVPKLEISSSL
ncbi:histidine kinase [Pontiellaceae bacterium B12219]|nr:histidine kinase [Pontiellaceae bacterium B12219]